MRVVRAMRVIACVVATLFCASPAFALVARPSLEELVARADLIVLGTNTEIDTVLGVRIATVEVVRTLKGDSLPELHYLAHRRWTCDITDAKIGEKAVLFLSHHRFNPNPRPCRSDSLGRAIVPMFLEHEPNGFREEVGEAYGGTPFLDVAWHGSGRMPIHTEASVEFVMLSAPNSITGSPKTGQEATRATVGMLLWNAFLRPSQPRCTELVRRQMQNSQGSGMRFRTATPAILECSRSRRRSSSRTSCPWTGQQEKGWLVTRKFVGSSLRAMSFVCWLKLSLVPSG